MAACHFLPGDLLQGCYVPAESHLALSPEAILLTDCRNLLKFAATGSKPFKVFVVQAVLGCCQSRAANHFLLQLSPCLTPTTPSTSGRRSLQQTGDLDLPNVGSPQTSTLEDQVAWPHCLLVTTTFWRAVSMTSPTCKAGAAPGSCFAKSDLSCWLCGPLQ